MSVYDALRAIRDRDPDAGDVEPTPAEYDRHREWAVAAFGEEVWDIYQSNWDQPIGI